MKGQKTDKLIQFPISEEIALRKSTITPFESSLLREAFYPFTDTVQNCYCFQLANHSAAEHERRQQKHRHGGRRSPAAVPCLAHSHHRVTGNAEPLVALQVHQAVCTRTNRPATQVSQHEARRREAAIFFKCD